MDEERRRLMVVGMTLDWPISAVFAHVATPAHLGDWLPGLRGADCPRCWRAGEGATFVLRPATCGSYTAGLPPLAAGDMVAYEPPREVAYRMDVGGRRYVVRVTCTDRDGAGRATRVAVRQGGEGVLLAVDLVGLGEALATSRGRGAAHGGSWRSAGEEDA